MNALQSLMFRHVLGWAAGMLGGYVVSKGFVSQDLWNNISAELPNIILAVMGGSAAITLSVMDKKVSGRKDASLKTEYEIPNAIVPEETVYLPEPSYVTKELLLAMGVTKQNANKYEQVLANAANEFSINTPLRVVHWLAQICQESGCLRYTRELWDGKGQQAKYDTRTDLGNTPEADGDGYHNRGVGFIQNTGETNIEAALLALGYTPDDNDALAEPEGAARSAGYFWKSHGLNEIADASGADVKKCTRVVNGGYTHLVERQAYFNKGMSYMASKYL